MVAGGADGRVQWTAYCQGAAELQKQTRRATIRDLTVTANHCIVPLVALPQRNTSTCLGRKC